MQLLLDIVSYLKDNSFVTDDGVDAFRDFMPDDPDNIVVVFEYNGMPPSDDGHYTNRSIQIAVRNASADAAKLLARNICNKLRVENNFVKLTDTTWSLVYIRNTPIKIKVDDRGRSVYAFNIGITSEL